MKSTEGSAMAPTIFQFYRCLCAIPYHTIVVSRSRDADGTVIATTTTNNAGNFIIENSDLCTQASCVPYRVRMTLDGRTREMLTAQTDGDCMKCHTAVGVEGAPGRIVSH